MMAIIKFPVMMLWFVALLSLAGLAMLLRLDTLREWLVRMHFRGQCVIVGIKLKIEGAPTAKRPLLVVSNHCSYIDIFVLGAAMPVSFTPKSDIKYWPLIGWSCMVARCVFVERKASKLAKTKDQIHDLLTRGQAICLFAEGTTNNGDTIGSFKSGFFSLAESEPDLMVQPVTIMYTHRNGKRLDAAGRGRIAWFGDDTMLLTHMMGLLSARSIGATLAFHEPVNMRDHANRKTLCKHCETVIVTRFEQEKTRGN